ncbi:hypothetical protein CEXT_112861 [Caerostris extrusa]|uniref:Uncharacterized protein n=1 Tax=Caerostris extrusa TaxID=172846 RepID=A0AAV4QB84_CAEEX|nr:hypothetical protein CEXT_112861 [Caerostris extrusa]
MFHSKETHYTTTFILSGGARARQDGHLSESERGQYVSTLSPWKPVSGDRGRRGMCTSPPSSTHTDVRHDGEEASPGSCPL